MKQTDSGEVGIAICKGMGLDPATVRRIEIVVDSNEVLHAKVTIFLDSEKHKKAFETITKLAWVDAQKEEENESTQ